MINIDGFGKALLHLVHGNALIFIYLIPSYQVSESPMFFYSLFLWRFC